MIARLPETRKNAALFGSRTEAQLGSGNVQAQAVYVGIDPATGIATYAVRVVNNSEQSLQAHVRFGTSPATSASIVAPFSILETMVPRPLAARHDDRAIVEIRSTGLALAIDAPAALPARIAYRRFGGYAAAACVVAGSLALAGGLFAAAQAKRALPVTVVSAAPVRAAFIHPAVHRAIEEDPILDTLVLSPSSHVAGEPLRVRYGAHAQSGDVWLLDDRGRVWARAAIAAAGYSSLTIPAEAAGRDLRVVVTATRGSQHAQRSAPVSVAPDPSNVAQTAAAAAAPPSEATVSPERVPSGGSIHIRLAPHHGEALVAVTDQGGSILEEVDVEPDRDTATLRAPEVGAPTIYDVVITLTKGNAQDQTVKAITVAP